MSEMTITFFNTADKSIETVASPEEIPSLLAAKKGFYWLDLNDTDTEHLTQILKTLDIDYQWKNYFGRAEILPHITDSPNLLSFYLYDIVSSETLLDSIKDLTPIKHAPILVILGVRFVITYRQQALDLIDFVRKDCFENFQLSGKTPGFVVFLLMQHCLYHFSRLNLANDNFLDQIASGLLSKKETESRDNISIAGLNILALKKLNVNLYIILLVIVTKHTYVISDESRVFFKHMLDNTHEIRNSIDSSRNSLDSIIASINAEHSRHTESIMRILTILSAVFLPLTVITGVYGMNFPDIPEEKWSHGYFDILGFMAGVVAVMLSLFYWFGWLKKE